MNQQKQKLMDAMVEIRFSPVEESAFSIYEKYESCLHQRIQTTFVRSASTGVSLISALENLKKPSRI